MIRIEGRNPLEEGFSGANARDMSTGRMTGEGADKLVDSLRTAINPGKSNLSSKNTISNVASLMAKNLGENTEAVQKIVESQGDETKKELSSLISKMAAAQSATGKQSVAAIKELIKQVERVKLAAGEQGEELAASLGLDETQKTLAKDISRPTVTGSVWRKYMKTDEGLGFKDSFKQAFTMEKMFGLKPSSKSIIEEQKNILNEEIRIQQQIDALNEVKETLIDSTESVNTTKNVNNTDNKTTKTVAVANISSAERTAEGGPVFTTTIDRESPDNKQVELLEQILEQLKKMESTTPAQSSDLGKFFEASMARALLPLTVIVGGISGIVWSIQKLAELDYVEKTATPILQSRDDMYLSGLGYGSDQVRKREAKANSPLQRAKDSGLYDKDYITNSEIDLNVLAATTDSSVLKSILNDNDISDSDRMRVERRLGQIEREQIDTAPIIGTGVLSSSTQEKIKSTSKNTSYVMERMFPISLNANRFNPEKSNSMIGTLENPRQSTEPDMLTIPGSGVLSPEAQGMTPEVTPTADAVYKTTEAYRQMVSNVTNIFNNTTNNNGSGPQPQPILVSPSSVRNNDNSFRFYQHMNK